MARTYPIELREKVLQAYDEGRGSSRQLAGLFHVSGAWIRKLLRQRRQTGSVAPIEYRPGRKPKLTDRQRNRLITLAGDQPDLTLAELRRKTRLGCSLVTIWRELKKAGFTFKRSP